MKRISFEPQAFPIIYLISIYSTLVISLFLQRVQQSDGMVFLAFALPQIAHLLTIAIYSKFKKVDVLAAIPLKFKISPKDYIWTVLTVLGLFSMALLPNILIMFLFDFVGLPASVRVPTMDSAKNILLGLLTICILPSLGEEALFRGVLVSSFREYGGVGVVLLSGLFFSLSHFNIAQTVYQFAIGALLCYLYLKTDNLVITILIHFLNNAIALFLPAVIPFFKNLGFNFATFAVLVPMCVIGLFIFVLAVRKLIKDVKSSSDIIVYEYQPEKDEFVAVATQKAEKRELKNAFSIVKREVSNTFIAIINTFKKGENKKRLDFFKAQFPKTRRINNVIKIMLAVIIGLWLLTILL